MMSSPRQHNQLTESGAWPEDARILVMNMTTAQSASSQKKRHYFLPAAHHRCPICVRTVGILFALVLAFITLPIASAQTRNPIDIHCSNVSEILTSTELVRKLKAQRAVSCRAVDEAQFRSLLEEQIARDIEPPRNEAEGRLFELLHILPVGFPYLRCIQELYNQQTAAFFRPLQHEFILPTWTASTEGTIVHELTHALQHQVFNLEHFVPPKKLTSDEFLARVAVVEGDAVVTEELHRKLSSLAPTVPPPLVSTAPPTLAVHSEHRRRKDHNERQIDCRLPALFSETYNFPYDAGSTFVRSVHERGGLDAVNQLYHQPPRTTSEVLHPERFPRKLPIGEYRGTLMEELPPERCRSCSRTFEDRVGELGIRVILDSKTSLDQARTAANGWEDDWLQFWESATQREVLWRVHLTTPTDAHELASAWSTALQNEKVMAMRKESSSVRWTFDGPWATTYSGSVEGRMFTFRIVSNEPPG